MSTQEPQFTITRKRKRQAAIDPCLGFYCNISSHSKSQSATAIPTSANNDDSGGTELPGWTFLPQGPPSPPSKNKSGQDTHTSEPSDLSSEPEPLNVETFLRRSALGQERIHVRRYGRKHRNRRIIISDNEGAEEGCPNGQLNDNGPQALSLFPIQKSNNDSVKAKPRAIRLWNNANAKGVPFRTSSFSESSKTKKEFIARGPTDVQCHPLSTWSTLRRPAHQNEVNHKTIRKRSTRCAPLVFVPLADVEKASSKKSHTASVTKRDASHRQEPQCPSIVPLTLVPADITYSTENESPILSYLTSSPIALSPNHLVADCLPDPAREVPDSLLLTALAPRTQASPACPEKTSDKRLKPLGSFLEGFIERVRAATQAEGTIAAHSDDQSSILEFVQSQESLVTSKPISEHGLEESLSTTQDLTSISSCPNGGRRPRSLAFTSSHAQPNSLHATTIGAHHYQSTSLDVLDDTCFASQEEFPPYVPPAAPFDINAALMAYTRVGDSCV